MKSKQSVLSPLVTAHFCRQLAMLLGAGISIHEALLLLQESSDNAEESRLYQRLADEIGRGQTLYSAMERSSRFTRHTIDIVKIGEASGRLDDSFEALGRYYVRNENLRQLAVNAMLHPFVMLCLLVALVAVLLVRVLPVFAQVYAQLGTTMSPFAQRLMSVGQWLGRSSLVIGAILIAAVVIMLIIWRSPAGRRPIQRFAARFPLTRPFVRAQNASHFSFAMALTLKSGMTYEQALGMAMQSIDENPHSEIAENGNPLEAILCSGLFDAADTRLLQLSARVGRLDAAMEDLAGRSEEKSSREAERLVGIIDPVMVSLMGIVAGMVLLSVMLPLLSIMAAI